MPSETDPLASLTYTDLLDTVSHPDRHNVDAVPGEQTVNQYKLDEINAAIAQYDGQGCPTIAPDDLDMASILDDVIDSIAAFNVD